MAFGNWLLGRAVGVPGLLIPGSTDFEVLVEVVNSDPETPLIEGFIESKGRSQNC